MFSLKKILNHLEYIKNNADKGYEEIDNGKRYSINRILFKKEFWNNIYDKRDKNNKDDEHDCLIYCYNNDKKIISALNVPLVHLFFFTQREENRDLIPIIRDYYSKVINAPYPIGICESKELENENRLRYLENIIFQINNRTIKRNIWYFILSVENSNNYFSIIILGIKLTIKKKFFVDNKFYESKIDRIFSIYKNNRYTRITILGIKITLKK